MPDFKELAKKLETDFSDLSYLETALTHRSYLNEHRSAGEHNERLEFLGDAVLELSATDLLYRSYPEEPEGRLTAYRAALVNTWSLAEAAEALGLSDYLRLSKGEAKDTGRARQVILANAFEAVIGAIYLDQGFPSADAFIRRTLAGKLPEILAKRLWQDPKSRFQELSQEHASETPRYETVDAEGPDHDKRFTVAAYVGSTEVARGAGKSKQEAEQAAAEAAILAMGW